MFSIDKKTVILLLDCCFSYTKFSDIFVINVILMGG